MTEDQKFLISEAVNLTKLQVHASGGAMDEADALRFLRKSYRTLKALTETAENSES